MSSERRVVISYTINAPGGTQSPVSSQTGQPIPSADIISFPVGGQSTLKYKGVLDAIKGAKEATGMHVFTPWRDAVGDREKGKDVMARKTTALVEEQEEEDEGETA